MRIGTVVFRFEARWNYYKIHDPQTGGYTHRFIEGSSGDEYQFIESEAGFTIPALRQVRDVQINGKSFKAFARGDDWIAVIPTHDRRVIMLLLLGCLGRHHQSLSELIDQLHARR